VRQAGILAPDIEGPLLAAYNPRFAENPEWADFNIQPIFFARSLLPADDLAASH
jgi:hypothetical protein